MTTSKPHLIRYSRNKKKSENKISKISPITPPKTKEKKNTTYEVILSNKISKRSVQPFKGNAVDAVVYGSKLAFSIQGVESFSSRELFILSNGHSKDIVLEHLVLSTKDGDVVLVNEEGVSSSAYFLPDFADLAMLPLPLKIVLKHMLESSSAMPGVLKRIWESCGPSLPTKHPVCCMRLGYEMWTCYSNSCKIQMVKILKPEFKWISLMVRCENVSSSVLDERKYVCGIMVYEIDTIEVSHDSLYDDPTILMWNCMGVERPSFLTNFRALMERHTPEIVVLIETRCSIERVKKQLKDFNVHKYSEMATDRIYGGEIVRSDTVCASLRALPHSTLNCGNHCWPASSWSLRVGQNIREKKKKNGIFWGVE